MTQSNEHAGPAPGANDPPPLQARRFLPALPRDPRHWANGDAVLSHVLNTYTLLVPGNEGFYIRTLKKCLPLVEDDKAMQEMIRQFLKQEGQHGVGHHRYWGIMEAQGYRIRGFLGWTDKLLYEWIEPITPLKLKLSMVSCVEHVNAYLGHEFLTRQILADAEPDLRALFEWHFAEEIEHKHVTYDVLNRLAPSYAMRLLGFLFVAPMFYLLMSLGTGYLLWQDRLLFKGRTWKQLFAHLFWRDHLAARTFRHLFNYLRPRFHPDQLDDRLLAEAVIARYSSPNPELLKPVG